jgi:hypothetical protein
MEAFIVVLNSLIPSSLLWWFVRTRLVSSLQRNFHPQHKEKRNFISCGSLFFVLQFQILGLANVFGGISMYVPREVFIPEKVHSRAQNVNFMDIYSTLTLA